jgi:hypothetical protein
VAALERLEALAVEGQAASVVQALRELTPGYRPDARWGSSAIAVAGGT